MTIFLNFITSFSMMFAIVYCWHKLLKIKFKYNNFKIYTIIFVLSIISMFNYFFVNSFIRITVITLIFMVFFRYIFKENLQKTVLTPIYGQAIMVIAEFMYALIMTIIFKSNVSLILESDFGIVFTNTLILTIFIIIMFFPYTSKLYDKLLRITNKIKPFQLIIFCLVIIIFLNLYIITAFFKIKFGYWILINFSLILICFFIVVYTFKTKNNYNIVYDKYSIAINSLKEYENMMTKYRIANHENKNLLLTIRAMILNKEDDIPKYIDSIVEEKHEDDEKLLFEMNVIPSGGLRAAIYSEILKIKKYKIDYLLEIDKQLSTVDLIELDENTIIDICKIIGVFIDNAIDEVKKLKTKNIQINLYVDQKNIYIKVSNNYKTIIDIDKIYNVGYTTKGKNHGYGLSVVKQIVDKNELLDNLVEINGKIFSQILKLKYKK